MEKTGKRTKELTMSLSLEQAKSLYIKGGGGSQLFSILMGMVKEEELEAVGLSAVGRKKEGASERNSEDKGDEK